MKTSHIGDRYFALRVYGIVGIALLWLGSSVSRSLAAETCYVLATSKHFEVRSSVAVDDAQEIIRDCELVLSAVHSKIGLAPRDRRRIRLVIHENQDSFLRVTGAKPSLSAVTRCIGGQIEIHIPRDKMTTCTLLHEVTHAVSMTWYNPGDSAPPLWFLEGVAMRVSYTNIDKDALPKDILITKGPLPLASLAASYPADQEGLSLALWESRSIVDYISDSFPDDRILGRIIARTAEGGSFEHAIAQCTGRTLTWWEHRWRASLGLRPARQWLPVISAASILCIVVVLLACHRRRNCRLTCDGNGD